MAMSYLPTMTPSYKDFPPCSDKFDCRTTSPQNDPSTVNMEDLEKDGGIVAGRPHVIDDTVLTGGERPGGVGDRDGRRRSMTSVRRLSISEDDIMPIGNATVPIEYRTLYVPSLVFLGVCSMYKGQSTSLSLGSVRQSFWKLLELLWSPVYST